MRSATSLIQTVGRAARHVEGKVIMYADTVTRSMQRAIDETARRRAIQAEYNEKHGITPKSIEKKVRDLIEIGKKEEPKKSKKKLTAADREKMIAELTKEMKEASKRLDFERAAFLRDRIRDLRTTE